VRIGEGAVEQIRRLCDTFLRFATNSSLSVIQKNHGAPCSTARYLERLPAGHVLPQDLGCLSSGSCFTA
jgi:hypothetical protein